MGYVGSTSAACLLQDGHTVIGIDTNNKKIEELRKGRTPMIYEKDIDELLYNGYQENRLIASTNPIDGVIDSDMIWICVGTPSKFNGEIDFCYIEKVIEEIGNCLKKTNNRPLIVVRSTCLPGSIDNKIKPLLENSSGLKVGKDINIIFVECVAYFLFSTILHHKILMN